MRLRLAGLLLALLMLASLGCGEEFDTREDPTLEEIMEIGKGYLREGNGGSAAEAFMAALNVSEDCSEAKFGLLIARNQQFLSLLNELISFTTNMTQTAPVAGDNGLQRQVLAKSEPLGDYIQDFLAQSADVWYDTCEGLYYELQAVPEPYFEIDGFTMGVEGIISFDFGGRLDRADLEFFGVLNALVRTVVDIAMAHDLNYDFFAIQIPALDLDFTNLTLDAEGIADLIAGLDPIFDLLRDLVTYEENPAFLTLKGADGVARMQRAGIDLGLLFWRLHLMIDETYSQTGAQSENSVRYVDENQDGIGDRQTEPLYLPGLGTLDAELVNALDTLGALSAGAFWDTTVYDFEPTVSNPFYIAFANELLTALDVLPIVINAEFLESLGIDLGALGDGLNIVIDEIPYILPIDVGPWFADPSPTGIKDLLWNIILLWDLVAELAPSLLG